MSFPSQEAGFLLSNTPAAVHPARPLRGLTGGGESPSGRGGVRRGKEGATAASPAHLLHGARHTARPATAAQRLAPLLSTAPPPPPPPPPSRRPLRRPANGKGERSRGAGFAGEATPPSAAPAAPSSPGGARLRRFPPLASRGAAGTRPATKRAEAQPCRGGHSLPPAHTERCTGCSAPRRREEVGGARLRGWEHGDQP